MAARSHHSNSSKRRSRSPIEDRRIHHRLSHSSSLSTSSRLHPAIILEDRIDSQRREIQTLLSDNQRLAATHVALKQELAATEDELRHVSAAAAKVKAERDDEVREVYEKSLKLDSEVRAMDAMMAELVKVRADVQKLSAVKQDLTAELKEIRTNLAKASSESQQLPSIKAEIDSMQHEIQRGRAAIEYEKRTHTSNLEHGQAMENSMIAISKEIEKLHAELANAEKRARAAAAVTSPFPGYAPTYPGMGMGYGGNTYPDPYSTHQFQGGAGAGVEIASQYAHVPAPYQPPQHPHMQ